MAWSLFKVITEVYLVVVVVGGGWSGGGWLDGIPPPWEEKNQIKWFVC